MDIFQKSNSYGTFRRFMSLTPRSCNAAAAQYKLPSKINKRRHNHADDGCLLGEAGGEAPTALSGLEITRVRERCEDGEGDISISQAPLL